MDKQIATTSTESSQKVKKNQNNPNPCKKPDPDQEPVPVPVPDTYYAYLFPNNVLVCNRNRLYLRSQWNITRHIIRTEPNRWYRDLIEQVGENLNEIQAYVENDPLNPGFSGDHYRKVLKRYLAHHNVRCVASSNTIDNLRTQLVALGLTFTTLSDDGRGLRLRYRVVDLTEPVRPLTYTNVISENDIYFPICHRVPDLRLNVLGFDP